MRHQRLLTTLALASALVAPFAVAPAVADDPRGSVQGLLRDAAGQPVEGGMVRLSNEARRLTFLVTSREGGRYEAKDLPVGDWRAQAVGGKLQSAVTPLRVTANESAKLDLAAAAPRGPMLPPAWPKRIPEAAMQNVSLDLPAGDGQKLVQERCTVCHTALQLVIKRADRADWEFVVDRMRGNMISGKMPDLTDQEAATALAYLTKNFGPVQPADPNARMPQALLQGKSRNYRAVTYELTNKFAEPHDVAADPTGKAWIAERAGLLGSFDPQTLEFTEVAIPGSQENPARQRLGNPQIDPRGMLWVADGPNGRWLRYDTKAGTFTQFPWPKGHGGAGGNSMALHPDGTIWGTGMNKEARRLDPTTGQFSFFESPSAKSTPGAYGVAVAGDGAVWWAEDHVDRMARLDPKTGQVEEFKIPYEGTAYPRRMNSDANGDLWVALWHAGKLMKIDHKTKEMTIFSPPSENGGAYSVVVDKKNNFVWLSEHQVDKMARFDPKTGEWLEFPLPYAESDPRRVDIDPTNPNRVFFSGDLAARVGFVELVP